MKKVIAMLLALMLMLPAFAMAESGTCVPGVTIAKDDASPTGYTVTFVYDNAEAKTVELVSNFVMFKLGNKIGGTPEERYEPEDFEPGMFRVEGGSDNTIRFMEKVDGTGLWTISVPLPSGHYVYTYRIDGETQVTDPVNLPLQPDASTSNSAKYSTFTVPYDAKQGASVNYDFLLPRTDGKVGKMVYADYTDVTGNLAPLAIYLPYGYDPDAAEAYPVAYMAHGGGDHELYWFDACGGIQTFDNLIADGKMKPTIMVGMSNIYGDDNAKNIVEYIIPYMEENFNVSKEAKDRSMAGLSMGGMITTSVYAEYPDSFGYIGIWGGTNVNAELKTDEPERLSFPKIMLAGGYYDMSLNVRMMAIQYIDITLTTLGIDHQVYIPLGGHSPSTWQQCLYIFASNYLWQEAE